MIREMAIRDYDALFALWSETEGLGLRALDDSRQGIDVFLKRNPATSFVAVGETGELTGAILCGHDGRRGYIYHTAVRAEHRGRGIGGQLVRAAVTALEREGITRVCLNVRKSNGAGRAFWEKQGWEDRDFLAFYSRAVAGEGNEALVSPEP